MPESYNACSDRFIRSNPFMSYNHIEIGACGEDWAEMYLDILPETLNTFGRVHGGAFFTLADSCAGRTARLDGRLYVTQDASVQFIHNVTAGRLTAHGSVVSRGRHVCVVLVTICGEGGTLLFHSTFTMYCVDADASQKP